VDVMQMKGEVHTTANTWIPQCVRQSAGEESAGAIATYVDMHAYALICIIIYVFVCMFLGW